MAVRPSAARTRIAIAAVVTAAAALAVHQTVLIATSWRQPQANAYYWRPNALAWTVIGVVFATVGLVIAERRPGNRMGWLLSVQGVTILLFNATGEYALRGLALAPGTLPEAGAMMILSQLIWMVPFSLLPILLAIYPTGRFLSTGWATIPVIAAAFALVLVVSSAILAWPQREHATVDVPFPEHRALIDAFGIVAITLFLVALVASVVSLLVRWRRSGHIERLQPKWLMLAGSILCVQAVGVLFETALTGDGPGWWWTEVLLVAGLLAVPVAVGMVVAMLFHPLRRRVQRRVDRRFNRSRYDAERVVEGFAGQLQSMTDLGALEADLRAAVHHSLHPAAVQVWVRSLP